MERPTVISIAPAACTPLTPEECALLPELKWSTMGTRPLTAGVEVLILCQPGDVAPYAIPAKAWRINGTIVARFVSPWTSREDMTQFRGDGTPVTWSHQSLVKRREDAND